MRSWPAVGREKQRCETVQLYVVCNLLGEKSATTALQSAATATPQCQTMQLHPTATVTSFQFDVEAVFKSIYRLCLKSIKVAFKSFLCFFCEDSQIVIVIEKRVC